MVRCLHAGNIPVLLEADGSYFGGVEKGEAPLSEHSPMPSGDVEVNSVNTKWKVNANRDKSFIVSAALRMRLLPGGLACHSGMSGGCPALR
jgi:hypothetical protein